MNRRLTLTALLTAVLLVACANNDNGNNDNGAGGPPRFTDDKENREGPPLSCDPPVDQNNYEQTTPPAEDCPANNNSDDEVADGNHTDPLPRPPSCTPTVDANNYTELTARDPLEAYQWYLDKLHVREAWQKLPASARGGAGIEIAMVDDSVQLNHEDLAENMLFNQSLDVYAANRSADGSPARLSGPPVNCNDRHGTSVAGILAAVGGNRRGMRGIAYQAKLWVANLISVRRPGTGLTNSDLDEVYSHRLAETAVSSNSWGSNAPADLIPEGRGGILTERIENGLARGFHGRGTSYVFSAGNFRQPRVGIFGTIIGSGDRANYNEVLNHQGVMPICAAGSDNNISSFSEPGSNLWVCGYSATRRGLRINTSAAVETPAAVQLQALGVPTLDLGGADGYNRGANTIVIPAGTGIDPITNSTRCGFSGSRSDIFNFGSPQFVIHADCEAPHRRDNGPLTDWPPGATFAYTRYFGGTSAAAPMISGIIGLMRAANRDLTWREVKLILAGTSWQPPDSVPQAGPAVYHNANLSYAYSDDFGFGIANASAAVDAALNWQPYQLPPALTWRSPAANNTVVYQPTAAVNITFVEYAQVEIVGGPANAQPNFGELAISLRSPNRISSVFTEQHQCVSQTRFGFLIAYQPTDNCRVFDNAFTFGASAHLGENPQGQWNLTVLSDGEPIDLEWRLILHGNDGATRDLGQDDDDDGILAAFDNCPQTHNPEQDNNYGGYLGDVCDDADGDTVVDADDNCPLTPNRDQANVYSNNSIGDACDDTDGDGALDLADNCPLAANPRQENHFGNASIGDACEDSDGDALLDVMDVDADGDGLLDVLSVANFTLVRHNLQGSSWRANASAAGIATGCGNATAATAAPGDITECSGYELFVDLDLASIPNWQPIGGCRGFNNCTAAFNTTFEGNGYAIHNLTITNNRTTYGVGLFGAISTTDNLGRAIYSGELRNLHIYNVQIRNQPQVVSGYVGGLAGYAARAKISKSSISGGDISGDDAVGGLVGEASFANLSFNYAELDSVISIGGFAGGLAGVANAAEISSNYARVDTIIAGGRYAGGLIGSVWFARASSNNYAIVNKIIGAGDDVGGLFGGAYFTELASSYAETGIIRGRARVGGLVGDGEEAVLSSSYADAGSIRGAREVGGLVGGGYNSTLDSNYALAGAIYGEQAAGGLVGNGTAAQVLASYALISELRSAAPARSGLVGAANNTQAGGYLVNQSYWWDGLDYTLAPPLRAADSGRGLSLAQLQNQTAFAGIYAGWDAARCAAGAANSSLTAWNLGSGTELPTLTCFGAEQSQRNASIRDQLAAQQEFIRQLPPPPAVAPAGCIGRAAVNISILDLGPNLFLSRDNYLFYKPSSIDDWRRRGNLLASPQDNRAELSLPCGGVYDFLAVGYIDTSSVLSCYLNERVNITQPYQQVNITTAVGGSCPNPLPYDVQLLSGAPLESYPPANFSFITDAAAANTTAKLAAPTDVDWYSFDVTRPGRVEIYTTGKTDTYGELYYSAIPFAIGSDDNSGAGLNFRIEETLRTGIYYLRVASSPIATRNASGDYTLFIRRHETGCRQVTVDNRNYTATPTGQDPLEPYQWYLAKHYVYDAWRKVGEEARAGAGIEIAVVDDGVQLNHEDLAPNVIKNASLDVSGLNDSDTSLADVPLDCRDSHGTAVAGIINAAGDNRRGLRGIAYQAKLWAANYISTLSAGGDEALRASLGQHRLNTTAISSNSWGSGVVTQLDGEPPSRPQFEAVQRGIKEGYVVDGKSLGVSFVFSAGNSRQAPPGRDGRPIANYLHSANYEETLNYIGVIPVCAVGADDNVSSYSDAGSNLWVCGYSGSGRRGLRPADIAEATNPKVAAFQNMGMPTLDLSGPGAGYNLGGNTTVSYFNHSMGPEISTEDCDSNNQFDFGSPYFELDPRCAALFSATAPGAAPPRALPSSQRLDWPDGATTSYTRYFSGTSAAAPAVSGMIALVRAANRGLTWREVKLILAGSAWLPEQARVPVGASTYHNASERYAHHIDYGFGIVNASKAVDLALGWRPLPPLQEWHSGAAGDAGLSSANISYQRSASSNITFVEFVNVEILGDAPNTQPNFGALSIKLISPNGRESVFTRPHQCVGLRFDAAGGGISFAADDDCPAFSNAFTFGSAAHLGEDPQGQWQLLVNSTADPALDHLQWRLILHGNDGGSRDIGDDNDGDGKSTFRDNCPAVYNPEQKNTYGGYLGDACEDTDGDTVVDADDNCPLTPNRDQANVYSNNSIGDACDDTDGDGALDLADNCPLAANPRQENHFGNASIGDACENTDGDDYVDALDVDADGDGLLDILSLANFTLVRNNLQGSSWVLNASAAAAEGNSRGCGNATAATAAPGDLTQCSGYELFVDLDLASIPDWQPIGGCAGLSNCPNSFNATFEGNGYAIHNLTITNSGATYGSGLFGAISTTDHLGRVIYSSEIRNLHLYNVLIQDAPARDPRARANSVYVGGLAGFAAGARITKSSVTAIAIGGGSNVGGLVGLADEAVIESSHAVVDDLRAIFGPAGGLAGSLVGSLVGTADLSGAGVSSSYAKVARLEAGGGGIGGLVGDGSFATISSSHALSGRLVAPGDQVGGLLGDAAFAAITSSYALSDIISGRDEVGGLVGQADYAQIAGSYAKTQSLNGRRSVGGLAGRAFDDRAIPRQDLIARSYAIADSINGEQEVGGLIGNATGANVWFSYALTGELRSAARPLGGLLGAAANTATNPNYSLRASYWWDAVAYTEAQNISAANSGRARSLTQLQNQTSFAGIYSDWGNTACLGESDWVLGNSSQLPRLRCLGAMDGSAGAAGQNATLAAQDQEQAEFLRRHLRRPATDGSAVCTGLAELKLSAIGELQRAGNPTDFHFFYKPSGIASWQSRTDLLGGVSADAVTLRLPCGGIYDFLLVEHSPNSLALNCDLIDNVTIVRQDQPLAAAFTGGDACPNPLPYEIERLAGLQFANFPPSNPTPLADAASVSIAAHLAAAQMDWYNFTLPRAARVEIFTAGNADTYGELYRAGVFFPLARDDNSGAAPANFRLAATLRAGSYYLRVAPSPAALVSALGDYRLIVRKEEDGCPFIMVDDGVYANSSNGRDPLEPYQWYLSKHYIYDAWGKVDEESRAGAGIEIAVVDDGLQLNHEDIAANVIPGANIDLSSPTFALLPAEPVHCSDSHGTAVAGIINAVGGNSRGIRGIAHQAKVWAANYISHLGRGGGTDAALRLALGRHRLNATAVSSSSWGTPAAGTQLVPELPSRPVQWAINQGLAQGFDRKGISYVFAAGNRRRVGSNANLANYEEYLNYIGIIPVCAVGVDDRVSAYSDAGSNLWVCGYSNSGRRFPPSSELAQQLTGMTPAELIAPDNLDFHHFGVPTLDLSGEAGFNRGDNTRAASFLNSTMDCVHSLAGLFDFASPSFDIQDFCGGSVAPPLIERPLPWPEGATASYTRHFGGTSAAAPAVSGMIALVRAANPELTWREVKLILAGSAWLPEDLGGAAGMNAGASAYHNASEYYAHHLDYGFGIVNASKAIDLAMNWRPLPELLEWHSGAAGDAGMSSANISYQPEASSNITFVEFVNVEILGDAPNTQPNFGALSIKLISPSGKESIFTRPHDCLATVADSQGRLSAGATADCPAFSNAFTFGSAAHLGEDPQGEWRLLVNSTADPALDHLQWRLILHGHN